MYSLDEQLATAFAHHTEGRLSEAEVDYRHILQNQPDHIKVNYLLGSLLLLQETFDESAQCLSHVIKIDPLHVQARANLVLALQQSKRGGEALEQYDWLIKHGQATPALLNNRGVLLLAMDDFNWAAESFKQAIELKPDFVEAFNNLGLACQHQNKIEDAIEALEHAWNLQPANVEVIKNLGGLYYAEKKYNEAEVMLKKAKELLPFSPLPSTLLAKVWFKQNKLKDALFLSKQALKLSPNNFETGLLYADMLRDTGRFIESAIVGNTLLALGEHRGGILNKLAVSFATGGLYEKAQYFLSQAIAFDNKAQSNFFVKGWIASECNQYHQAIAAYSKVTNDDPNNGLAHWNKSLALFVGGQFEQGWREFAWRFDKGVPAVGPHKFRHIREWQGEPLHGRRIMIHGVEQGVGDIFQFMRYVKYVQQRGGQILFEAWLPVLNLLAGSAPQAEQIDSASCEPKLAPVTPEFDIQVPLLNLPLALGMDSLQAIPYDGPYVEADTSLVAAWSEKLGPRNKFRVGIVWAGNPEHGNDHHRSAMLADFAPLMNVPGIQLYSIQKGKVEIELMSPSEDLDIKSLSEGLKDFSHTAAVIANLDLVISVDTSVVHLAGAMGRPTWTLLAYRPDWRWMLDRKDTPWYPSMTLYRQQERGNWPLVFEEISKALFERVTENADEITFSQLDQKLIEAALKAKQGNPDHAWNIYQTLLSQPNYFSEDLFRQVIIFAEKYDYVSTAIDALRRLLRGSPTSYWPSFALAKLLNKNSKLNDAEALLRNCIEMPEAQLSAWMLLGNILHDQGRLAEALEVWERSLLCYPDNMNIHYALGRSLQANQQLKEAIVHFRQVIEAIPRHVRARNNLAVALEQSGFADEALEQIQLVLRYAPNHLHAWSNLGRLLVAKGEFDISEACLVRAIQINPALAETHYALGTAYQGLEKYENALAKYQEALEIKPNMPEVYAAMGVANWQLGNKDLAEKCRAIAMELDPEFIKADFSMSGCYLPDGDFKNGWKAYEARLKVLTGKRLQSNSPSWEGGDLGGKKLLIMAEQGYGDSIQFARLISLIPSKDVLLVCQDGLEKLLSQCPGVKSVVARSVFEANPMSHDVHAYMMSLPLMLGIDDVAKIPTDVPYLFADEKKTEVWAKHLAEMSNQVRVGLVWGGNPNHKGDKARSMSLRHFLPLADFAGVDLFSLQKGERVFEGNEYGAQLGLFDLDGDLTNWDETAAAIMNLDLVITVDTAIAHLAGALGIPVWVLIPKIADWRWIEGLETSPWYPTMRVFRQTTSGDWAGVVERVKYALGDFVAAKTQQVA